jgi:hypothetical protein
MLVPTRIGGGTGYNLSAHEILSRVKIGVLEEAGRSTRPAPAPAAAASLRLRFAHLRLLPSAFGIIYVVLISFLGAAESLFMPRMAGRC